MVCYGKEKEREKTWSRSLNQFNRTYSQLACLAQLVERWTGIIEV